MKFLDLFAGIGGFRLGLEMAGHECVGHVEIDKYAHKSYMAMHQPKEDEYYADDIFNVNPEELPEFEILTGGFPCQAFSVAGKRGGFDDTRGTLFFEIMRIARVRKPKYLFLENVKGLLSHDGGKTFGVILRAMAECGYDAEWQVCNSKNYGVPQNRERVFIIGILRGKGTGGILPITNREGEIDEIEIQKRPRANINPLFKVSMSESTRRNIADSHEIRDLMPIEYFRLQGFPDDYFERAAEVNSDSQLYKQAGNSVTVNVIYEIAKKLD